MTCHQFNEHTEHDRIAYIKDQLRHGQEEPGNEMGNGPPCPGHVLNIFALNEIKQSAVYGITKVI